MPEASGSRRVRVVFCRNNPSTSANTDGQIPEAEEERFERTVTLKAVRGMEKMIAQQTKADADYTAEVLYDKDTKNLSSKWWMKVKQTGVRLNIVSALDPEMAERRLVLKCKLDEGERA